MLLFRSRPLAQLSLAVLLTTMASAAEPTVKIAAGELRGLVLGDHGAAFRGIPFAQPPVGDLRWREPQPVKPWSGVRDAVKPGPPGAQPSQGWNAEFAAASSEDCLYLDVWTPQLSAGARLPVMVWLHGGANVAGAGGFDQLYRGQPLIDHGVVLVVVEYRLGVFGFFAHPELTRESPHHASGNYAILDQLAALRWVRENIAAFGGDPDNVTLFGQSAGSMDVAALLASPLTRGLVHRAIAQSGVPMPMMNTPLADSEKRGAEFAKKVLGDAATLARLRALSTEELLKAGAEQMTPLTVDGWVFPESTISAWQHGRALRVPLIIGTAAVEFPMQGDAAALRQMINEVFGARADRALAAYELDHGRTGLGEDPLYGNVNDQWGTDFIFRGPAIVYGEWQANAGAPVWLYQFDRAIPPRRKVEHSGDLPYVFGHFDLKSGNLAGEYTPEDRKLSETIRRYWTNFAKTGNPNGAGVPEWPANDSEKQRYLEFTPTTEIATRDHPRPAFTALFRELLTEAGK